MDLSKFSDDDLVALKYGELSRVSDAGLALLKSQMSQKRRIESNPAEYDASSPEFQAKYGQTSGMSGFERFAAGAGKSMTDLARGAGQYLGLVSREDVAESRERDAPLMATTGGKVGGVTGAVATGLPSLFVPGANTLAGASLIGAGYGALQPSTSTGETLTNTGVGAVLSPAALLAGRGVSALYRGGKAVVEPLTEKGQERIAARTLQAFAGGRDQARQAAANIGRNLDDTLPGIQPTTAELAENAGLAQMQRTLRNNPDVIQSFSEREVANRTRMIGALDDIAGDDVARANAVSARDTVADDLYGRAREQGADASRIAKANAAASKAAAEEMRSIAGALPMQSDEQAALMLGSRSSRDIQGSYRAVQNAAEEGALQFDQAGNITGGRFIGGLDIGDLLKRPALRSAISSARTTASDFGQSVDNNNPVSLLHWAKKTLDGQIGEAARAGNNIKLASLKSAQKALLNRIEDISPSYKLARESYEAASVPINRMDIGAAFRDRLVPALGDSGKMTGLNANAFAQALRKGDDIAANVTGFSRAKLADILTKDQVDMLGKVSRQLARQANANDLGRAAGSNTAQNLASQNIMRQFLGPLGLPESTMQRAAESTLLQSVMRPAQFTVKLGEQRAIEKLAQAALDPKKAQGLLEAGVDPQVIGWLRYQGLLGPSAVSGANAAKQ